MLNNKAFTFVELAIIILIYIAVLTFSVSLLSSMVKSAQCKKIANIIDTETMEYIEALKGKNENRDEDSPYYNEDLQNISSELNDYNEGYYEINFNLDDLLDKYKVSMDNIEEYYQCIETESIYAGKIEDDNIIVHIPLPIMTADNVAYDTLGVKLFLYGETGRNGCAQYYDTETDELVEYCRDSDYQLEEKQIKDREYDGR